MLTLLLLLLPALYSWFRYASRGSALVGWVKHRLVAPESHVVYLLRLAAPDAFYVGVTLARRFLDRMDEHGRSARRLMRESTAPDAELRAYAFDANEAYVMRCGFDRVESVVVVPDLVAALLLEVEWTCVLAGAGLTVFGHCLDDLCPAGAWLERRPSWDRNTIPAAHLAHVAPRSSSPPS